MGLIGRSLSHQRNARISCADRFDHAIGLPDQVEGLRIIPRGKPVRGLGHDRNADLQAGMLRCVGCEKGGKRAQRFRDHIADHIFRGLTIEDRVRYRQKAPLTGHGLGRLLKRLRLKAHQKRHQIAEQRDELLDVWRAAVKRLRQKDWNRTWMFSHPEREDA